MRRTESAISQNTVSILALETRARRPTRTSRCGLCSWWLSFRATGYPSDDDHQHELARAGIRADSEIVTRNRS